MWLGKSPAPGISIKFTWSLPEKPTKERFDDLVTIIRYGSPENRDKAIKDMIECHLRLALSVAAQYTATSPNLVDEYVSTAFLATTKAVEKAVENNIFSGLMTYIYKCVHRECAEVVRELCPITFPRRRSVSDEKWDAIFKEYVPYDEQINPIELADTDEDVRYILSKITKSPFESACLTLAEKGYTLDEIRKQLGCSIGTVSTTLSNLHRLYKEARA